MKKSLVICSKGQKTKHLGSSTPIFCTFLTAGISYSFLLVRWPERKMVEMRSGHFSALPCRASHGGFSAAFVSWPGHVWAFPAPASVTGNAAVPGPRCPWVPSPALSLPGPYGPLCLPWVRRPLGSPTCPTARLALQQPGGQRSLLPVGRVLTLLPAPLPHSTPCSALKGVGLLQVIVRRPLPPWVAL